MADPMFAENRLAKTKRPLFILALVAFVVSGELPLQAVKSVRAGSQTDDRLAGGQIVVDVLHLIVGKIENVAESPAALARAQRTVKRKEGRFGFAKTPTRFLAAKTFINNSHYALRRLKTKLPLAHLKGPRRRLNQAIAIARAYLQAIDQDKQIVTLEKSGVFERGELDYFSTL